ncbi:hypothetical protein VMCG_02846 [Cytospora schulzeri]|uniref:Uncharacterized protein n=1 Tax=Cytospora schulzeri TaxID=448051 RepID=A0A423WZH2_9PEZI|nr:hypothetical protein VMCG_02846 [Valsa malicola]
MDDQEMGSTGSGLQVPGQQAPMLPQKSALRASRLLGNLVGLKLTMPTDPPAFRQTPHEEYLSSEEEASSTAGDFSDFEYDSSSDDISPPTKDRMSHEDTARVVSVIFSGKPSVVDVPQNRRSISPVSMEERRGMLGVATPSSASERQVRRRSMSASTTSSESTCTKPMLAHPPRSSSMQPPTKQDLQKNKPYFLQIDPYANGSMYSLESRQEPKEVDDEDRPKTPKTPTQILRGVARSLSLMKKRSMPKMNQSFLSPSTERLPVPASPSKLSIAERPLSELIEEPQEISEITTVVSAPPAPPPSRSPPTTSPTTSPASSLAPRRPGPSPISAPVTYDDIVRVAKRNEKSQQQQQQQQQQRLLSVQRTPTVDSLESPVSPLSPLSTTSTNNTATSGKRISSFNAARRRMSVKLTGKFQL